METKGIFNFVCILYSSRNSSSHTFVLYITGPLTGTSQTLNSSSSHSTGELIYSCFHSLNLNGTARATVSVGVSAGALEDLGVVGVPSAGEVVHLGNTLEVLGVLGNRVGNGLCVDEESLLVEVVDGVASLVVVDVVSNTSLTTELLGLLLGLELLSTSEETTRGNTVLDESSVVRATAELRRNGVETLGLEELLKVLLDGVGTSRAGQVEGITITVVDTVDVVGAGNHVEVEVGADLGDLGVGAVDALHVGVRSKKTELLSTPETEANGILDAVLSESLGNVEDTNDTRAIVAENC